MSAQSPPTSDAATLAKGAGLAMAGRAGGRAAGLLATVLMGRVLGPASFGLFAIGSKVVLLAGLLSTLGLEHGVIRYGSAAWRRDPARLRGLVSQCLGLTAAVGLVLALGLYLLADTIAVRLYHKPALEPVLELFACGLALLALLKVAAAATRASKDMRYSVLAEDLGQPLAQLCLVALCFLLGWRLHGAVLATVVSWLVGAALALAFAQRLFGWLSAGERSSLPLAELLGFSLPTAMAGMLGLLVMWVDLLLVGYFLTKEETGVYHAAAMVASVFPILLASFNAIFSPMISELCGSGELARLDRLYKLATRWAVYLALPVFLVILLEPAQVIGALFGAEYASGAGPALILSAGQLVNLCTGSVGFLLVMSGRQNWWLVASAAGLAGNTALSLLLIPRYGLVGAAIASAITLAALFGSGLLLVRRSMGLWPYDRRYLAGLAAGLAAAVATALAARFVPLPPPLGVLVLLAVSSGVFLAVLLALGLDSEDRDVLGLLTRRLRR